MTDRVSAQEVLEHLLLESGLTPGGPVFPGDGLCYRVWLRDGEPVVFTGDEGEGGDPAMLHRLAWSSGCRCAIVVQQGRFGLIDTVSAPSDLVNPRVRYLDTSDVCSIMAAMEPGMMPGIVDVLVERMEAWRGRILRRALAERADWTEDELSLAVERPIIDLIVGDGSILPAGGQMHADFERAGVDLSLVPPGLRALAWDRHLFRRIRVNGGEFSLVGTGKEVQVPSRMLLSQFARWAGSESKDIDSILVPGCGAGRLLLYIAGWAKVGGIEIFAIDPDPRATLFSSRLLEREAAEGLSLTVRSGNPLVENNFFDGTPGQLIPADSRSRLRAVDWKTIFGGVQGFDRVLIGDPVFTMTRRPEVRRYLEEHYRSAGSGTNPALLLAEAGAGHLNPGGRVLALYSCSILRSDRATMLRRWLGPRTEVICDISLDRSEVALRIAQDPVEGPIVTESLVSGQNNRRAYPRSALEIDSWSFGNALAAERRRCLVTGCASLGEVVVGGVRPAQAFTCDPALMVEVDVRHRLLKADRRAARVIRPVIGLKDLVPYGTAMDAARFAISGNLPPRAARVARRMGIIVDVPLGNVPLPSGPRLLFEEGTRYPIFLYDHYGDALTSQGIAEVLPANLFLHGLLQSAMIGSILDNQCHSGVTARCLSRIPIRLPDPYDPRECGLGDRIASLVWDRITTKGKGESDRERRTSLESAIEDAIRDLYGLSVARDEREGHPISAP